MKIYIVTLLSADMDNCPWWDEIEYFENKEDAEKFIEYFGKRADGKLYITERELVPKNGINFDDYEKENEPNWLLESTEN